MAKAASVATVPTDPVELLSTPLAGSGLAAGTALRRAGIKLDFYTVRDLLFHLPRRYDDLREMRKIGDLGWVADGTVVSAQATVGDVRVEPGFRGRTQRTIARLEDETGSIDATWFGRRFIERRLFVGAEIVVSGKVKHFGRRLTLDNPEFQVVADDTELLHAGRIVPVYRLTGGLTAVRLRSAIREALDKAGFAYPEYLPAEIVAAGGARADRPGDRGGPLPGLVPEPRRGPPPARLRRVAGPPARDGRPSPATGPRCRAAGRHRRDPGYLGPVGPGRGHRRSGSARRSS